MAVVDSGDGAGFAWWRCAARPTPVWLAIALVLGNLLDAVFTCALLELRLVDEANPIMRWAWDGSPLWFIVIKVASVQVGLQLLWRRRHLPCARAAMAAGATLYTFIVVHQLALMAVIPSLLRS